MKSLNCVNAVSPIKRAMMWAWGIAAVLVFSPATLQQKLGLADMLAPVMPIVGLVFICLAAVFVTEAVLVLLQSGAERSRERLAQGKIKQKLAMLDHEEKAVLREFFIQRKHTISLPISEPAVRSLVDTHVLRPVDPDTDQAFGLFCLDQNARPLLTSTVLNLPTSGLTEDHIRYIKSTRPSFVVKDIRARTMKAA